MLTKHSRTHNKERCRQTRGNQTTPPGIRSGQPSSEREGVPAKGTRIRAPLDRHRLRVKLVRTKLRVGRHVAKLEPIGIAVLGDHWSALWDAPSTPVFASAALPPPTTPTTSRRLIRSEPTASSACTCTGVSPRQARHLSQRKGSPARATAAIQMPGRLTTHRGSESRTKTSKGAVPPRRSASSRPCEGTGPLELRGRRCAPGTTPRVYHASTRRATPQQCSRSASLWTCSAHASCSHSTAISLGGPGTQKPPPPPPDSPAIAGRSTPPSMSCRGMNFTSR